MSNCNCCGCTIVDVLHRYAYPDSQYTLSAILSLLATGGSVSDNSAAAYPTTVTTTDAWSTSGTFLQMFPDADGRLYRINGNVSGGSSSLNLGASAVQVDARWSPLSGRETNHAYIYDAEHPPTLDEKTEAVSVSLLGTVTATATAELVPRNLPDGFADPQWIYYDAENPPAFGSTNFPNQLEPRVVLSGATLYLDSPYKVGVQSSIVSCLKSPYGGNFELFLAQSFYDLPEPAGEVSTTTGPRAIPAHPGTPLDDFLERTPVGLEQTIVYAESVSLKRLGNDNDQAWSVHATRAASGPPNTEGFQAKMSLAMPGETRLIVSGPVWSQFSEPVSLHTAIRCLSLGDPADIPANGLCTAYVDRGAAGLPNWYSGQNQQRTLHTYFRDGVEVLAAVNPSQGQIDNACKAEGSYLAVYEQTADPWAGVGPDTRRWNPGWHKSYGSFIRDTTPPAVGFTVPDDVYWDGVEPLCRVVATEPLSRSLLFPYPGRAYACDADERTSGFYARPSRQQYFVNSTNGARIVEPGDYVLAPRTADSQASGLDPAGLTDDAGNAPTHVPTVRWKAHTAPADNHRGATAALTNVGLETCEYYRARSQQEKVASVTLSFDRKIDPSGVDIEQFTLTRWDDDGTSSVVSGVQIEPIDDGSWKWAVTVPTSGQAERTFWVLEYDPAGEVFTDDVATVVLPSIDKRPEVGQTKTIYVYPAPDNPEREARSYWSCEPVRENPNLTPYVYGDAYGTQTGSGAVLTATMVSNGDDPETWGVASITIVNGGSGYQAGQYIWYEELPNFSGAPPYYLEEFDGWWIESVDENGAITAIGLYWESFGRFYKATSGQYVDLAEGDVPLDCSGFPYNPEPCVLAARVSWLMADESGWPRLINTGQTTGAHGIGRVVSLSQQVTIGKSTLEDPAKKITTISADDNISLPITLGSYSPTAIREGYVPCVPTASAPTQRHSYFGLTTTIDPCEPADVSPCAAPLSAQKHASAIRCDGDISGFEIELVAYQFDGGALADMSKVDFGNTGDFSVLPDLSSVSAGGDTAAVLLAKDGGPITFGTTLAGEALPQNVWMAVEGSRETELPLKTAVSRPPDATCTSGSFQGQWYRLKYRFDRQEYSQEDVLGWPAIKVRWPAIRRADGTLLNGPSGGGYGNDEIELLPGDYYDGFYYGMSMAGQLVEWWRYRRPPEIWPTDWHLPRGQDSGIVRQLAGAVTQSGLQACLSAWRNHLTYPALKTTTLGDLVLSLSIRVTLQAEIQYTDWQLQPVLFTTTGNASPCDGLVAYDSDSLIFGGSTPQNAGTVPNTTFLPTPSARGYTDVVGGVIVRDMVSEPLQHLNAWQKLADATAADSRTITHKYVADINDTIVLNKEQEGRLAAGEDVMVRAYVPDGTRTYFWRMRKA